MRILRVSEEIFPEVLGGGTYHAHAISRDQTSMGHDVTVLAVSDNYHKPKRERRAGYDLVRCHPDFSVNGWTVSFELLRLLRYTDDYDIVHAHSHVYFATSAASFLHSFTDTPVAVTCHGLHSVSVPHVLSKLHLVTVGAATYKAADVVFCYTDVERSRLRSLGVGSDIEVVANGVDVSRFRPGGDEKPEIARHDGPSVLFVGRLSRGKCPKDALDIIERLSEEHPDAALFFCGDGDLREELERAVERRDLREHVSFLGHVPYESMPSVYRAGEVLVLPSIAEGFPRTVLEALACRTPVVATNLEQMRDVLERTGVPVEHGEVEGFAEAISGLIENREQREAYGERGRRLVEDQFSWTDTVRRTTDRLETYARP
jgi:glycosyltransferase involved in cell wall biosynthesis